MIDYRYWNRHEPLLTFEDFLDWMYAVGGMPPWTYGIEPIEDED